MSGLLGIAALVGLFLGAAVGGWLTDLIGRHKMFILDLIVIVVLSALCAVVTSPLQLVALRFLIGVAIGADYPIATSMIAEFSPRKHRAMSMGISVPMSQLLWATRFTKPLTAGAGCWRRLRSRQY